MSLNYAELFAGLGLASLAIKKVFGDAKCVFYSEIEPNRCRVLKKLHPETENAGDIDYQDAKKVPDIDLIVGGSPCQNMSIANTETREGLDGHESGLFYQFLEIIREKKPKYFLLENVKSMDDKDRDEISRCLGVQPILISSITFTGQARMRYYWANFPINPIPQKAVDPRWAINKKVSPDLPAETFINLAELKSAYTNKGALENPKAFFEKPSKWDFIAWSRSTRYFHCDTVRELDEWKKENKGLKYKLITKGRKKTHLFNISYVEQRIKINMQANTLVTGKGCGIFSSRNYVRHGDKMRMLTPDECANLQGIPDGHLEGFTQSAAYAAVGDSFTLDVITHIMESLKQHIEHNKRLRGGV